MGSSFTFDVFSGGGTEALSGHVAVVARFNAAPSTEQLACLVKPCARPATCRSSA